MAPAWFMSLIAVAKGSSTCAEWIGWKPPGSLGPRAATAIFRIPQASIVFNTRTTGSLFTHVHVNLDLEPEHPGGRYGWDRIRLVEAFADWRWNFAPPLELRVKGRRTSR